MGASITTFEPRTSTPPSGKQRRETNTVRPDTGRTRMHRQGDTAVTAIRLIAVLLLCAAQTTFNAPTAHGAESDGDSPPDLTDNQLIVLVLKLRGRAEAFPRDVGLVLGAGPGYNTSAYFQAVQAEFPTIAPGSRVLLPASVQKYTGYDFDKGGEIRFRFAQRAENPSFRDCLKIGGTQQRPICLKSASSLSDDFAFDLPLQKGNRYLDASESFIVRPIAEITADGSGVKELSQPVLTIYARIIGFEIYSPVDRSLRLARIKTDDSRRWPQVAGGGTKPALKSKAPPAASEELRGADFFAAVLHLKPSGPRAGEVFNEYLRATYPDDLAAVKNEFEQARLREKILADLRTAEKRLPKDLIFVQNTKLSVLSYDMKKRVLRFTPPRFLDLQISDSRTVSAVFLKNMEGSDLKLTIDAAAAERFVSLLPESRLAEARIRYRVTGVKAAYFRVDGYDALEAVATAIDVYPDEAHSMSFSLLSGATSAKTEPTTSERPAPPKTPEPKTAEQPVNSSIAPLFQGDDVWSAAIDLGGRDVPERFGLDYYLAETGSSLSGNEFERKRIETTGKTSGAASLRKLRGRFDAEREFLFDRRGVALPSYDFKEQGYRLISGRTGAARGQTMKGRGQYWTVNFSNATTIPESVLVPMTETDAEKLSASSSGRIDLYYAGKFRITSLPDPNSPFMFTGEITAIEVYLNPEYTRLLARLFPSKTESRKLAPAQVVPTERPKSEQTSLLSPVFAPDTALAASMTLGPSDLPERLGLWYHEATAPKGPEPVNEFERERSKSAARASGTTTLRRLKGRFDPAQVFSSQATRVLGEYDFKERGFRIPRLMPYLPENNVRAPLFAPGSSTEASYEGRRRDWQVKFKNLGQLPASILMPMPPERAEQLASQLKARTLHYVTRFRVTSIANPQDPFTFDGEIISIDVYKDPAGKELFASFFTSEALAKTKTTEKPRVADPRSSPQTTTRTASDPAKPVKPSAGAPIDRRREAGKLIANGRACDAVTLLQSCADSDRACRDMLGIAREQCRR